MADTRFIFTREPVRESIWLNDTFLRDTALNSLMGMLTSPKLIEPLHTARAMTAPVVVYAGSVFTSAGNLSIRSPLYDGWRRMPSVVRSVYSTSVTSRGSTNTVPFFRYWTL